MTGDEKFLWKNISVEDARTFTRENVKDIIAMGFDIRFLFYLLIIIIYYLIYYISSLSFWMAGDEKFVEEYFC